MYVLLAFHSHGLSTTDLHTVYRMVIVAKLTYAYGNDAVVTFFVSSYLRPRKHQRESLEKIELGFLTVILLLEWSVKTNIN
jgi:hypothetical protein